MVFVTNSNLLVRFCTQFCLFALFLHLHLLPFVDFDAEYFHFIISFCAYLFVTLQSQMKNRFQLSKFN